MWVRKASSLPQEAIKVSLPSTAVVYDVITEGLKRLDFGPEVKEGSLRLLDPSNNPLSNQFLISSLALQPQDILILSHAKTEMDLLL